MELAINVRNWGPTATEEFIRNSVLAADESSLDALWFNDHLCFPPAIANNFYGVPRQWAALWIRLAWLLLSLVSQNE